MKEVFIVSAVRTPMGSFGGSLKDFSATQLGAFRLILAKLLQDKLQNLPDYQTR